MILGLGIDLIGITRIERALTTARFLERVYSPREQAQIALKGASTAAGYFAAKEAVSKALGTGFRGFMLWDIEIVPDETGCPTAALYRGARERMEALGGRRILLSITHADGCAAAVAVISSD